jgi:hypothetical protein
MHSQASPSSYERFTWALAHMSMEVEKSHSLCLQARGEERLLCFSQPEIPGTRLMDVLAHKETVGPCPGLCSVQVFALSRSSRIRRCYALGRVISPLSPQPLFKGQPLPETSSQSHAEIISPSSRHP